MGISSVLQHFICVLLVSHQMPIHSYDGNGNDINDIGCSVNEVECVPKARPVARPISQDLIDCEKPNNCQTNTIRQQPNDCQNQIDCQSNAFPHKSRHHRRPQRHRSHHSQRFTQQRTPEMVEMTALQVWNCDFGSNDCGIHNQYNMGSYFVPMPDYSDPVLGRRGLLYLDLSRAQSAGARLITPYFPTNGCRYACLTIEYILCGNGIENLYLIQQDVRNYCVWQKKNDHTYRWTTSSMTIDLTRSNPRFFIEVRFDPRVDKYGFVGISDMKFKYGECDHNEANECDLNRFIGTLI